MIQHRLRRRLLTELAALVGRGMLRVATADGAVHGFGSGGAPTAAIRFRDAAAERALLLDPELQLGELFMDERLVVEEGSIYDVLQLLLQDSKDTQPGAWVRLADRIRQALRRLHQRNTIGRARANVAHHYDLGNALYDLFLDPDRQYSCAYFEGPGQDLAAAQVAKRRHIAAKLGIRPGDRVLDIGCGWGGMARYLAAVTDAAQVTGITLSEEQLAEARRHAGDRLVFRLEDYRHTAGPFERIVSVGMFEHVGLGFHAAFFNKCRELLTEDGVMLLHFIGKSSEPDFNHPWVEKYIFPGGHLATLSEVTPAIERAGLVVTDIEVLRLHYARTLRLWRDAFLAQRDRAKALYDERFCRMWEFYLSMAEAAFRFEDVVVFQIQLARRQEAVPPTRDYIAAGEAALRTREAAAGMTAPDAGPGWDPRNRATLL